MKHIFLFIVIIIFLASCEKSEQRKFAGWGKKWNISISFDQTDFTPSWELFAPMEFNKRKGTVNINDSIFANYTYNADLNQIIIIDTTKISYNNVKVWALMVMDGLFNEDFTFVGGQWSYYLNMDSLNSEIQPKTFPYEYSSYNGWIAEIQE